MTNSVTPAKRRQYLGQHKCGRCCAVLVRVYDWLPACVLCAKCAAAEARQESETNEEDEGVDDDV